MIGNTAPTANYNIQAWLASFDMEECYRTYDFFMAVLDHDNRDKFMEIFYYV